MQPCFVTLPSSCPLPTGTSAPGIYFYYDFYPVSVNYEETKPGFLQFVTRICGIIGGVFTVAGVVDTLIFRISGAVKKVE